MNVREGLTWGVAIVVASMITTAGYTYMVAWTLLNLGLVVRG